MDPVTAALNLAQAIVALLGKIYDDTPPDVRKANIVWWHDNVSVPMGKLLAGIKIPPQP